MTQAAQPTSTTMPQHIETTVVNNSPMIGNTQRRTRFSCMRLSAVASAVVLLGKQTIYE